MGTDLTIARPAGAIVVGGRELDPARLIERWQEGRSQETLKAYAGDLAAFTRWFDNHLNQPALPYLSEGEAVTTLFLMHPGDANETARAYRSSMVDARLAPATINRRLSALRSLVSLGKQFGHILWELDCPDVKSQKYRDTRGPDPDDVARVLEYVSKQKNPATSARDVAIVMLLFANGLRVGEVTKLDLADLDQRGSRLQITGKGRREPEWVTLAVSTLKVLKTWISHRGREPGALFVGIDRHGRLKGRIGGIGIWDRMQVWGEALELVLRPHGFRHSAITAALDATNGDIRSARKFARHRNVEVTLHYDDNRSDSAGATSKLVAQRVAAVVDGLEARGDE